METLKYYFCLCLIVAVIRANPPRSTPSIEVSAEQLNIAAGESDSVTCTPGGYPLPSIQWRKYEGEFGAGTTISGDTLTIGNAQDSDRGYYVCVGVLGATEVAQKFVYVEIENAAPPPRGNLKVTVSQRIKNITRGGSGSIECTPEGNPLPAVLWIKSDGEFGDGVSQSGNTLIISDAREEDRGHYTCQGIVDGTVMVTDYSRVDIGDSVPSAQGNSKVTVSQRTISIPMGGSGSIECIPEGNPLPTVEWVKADGEFRDGVRRSGNTLTISDAREEDQGHYVCNGIVDETVMSTDYLSVYIEDSVPSAQGNSKVTVSQQIISIPTGGSGSIECTPEGNPLPTVQWTKSDGEFGNGVRQSGNTLIISDARDEDRGHYACQGIVDGTVMVTDYSRVDIEDAVPPARENPKVTVSQRTLSIPKGGSGSIVCTPEGNPLPTVQWTKSDGEFGNGVRQSGNTLIISDARDEDRGHYACQGIVDGTVMVTDYSRVDIEDAVPPARENPKVTVSQRTLSIPKGGSGSIVCTPEGNPLPTVQWTKSDGEFSKRVRQSGNTLIISDARDDDRGHYACQGIVDGTVMVTDYSRVDIEDAVPPARGNPKVTVSQRTLSIPKGGSGSIVCTPEGNPLPTVQWTKSDGEFGNGVRQSGNTLIISDARDEDRGHYACQGIVDGTVMVTDYSRVDIEEPSPQSNLKVTVSQRTLLIPLGGRGTIECTPEGNPLPRVQWIKSDGEFRDGISQSGNTLIISDAREEDRGHYVCQGIVDGTVMLTNYSSVEIDKRYQTLAPVTTQMPQTPRNPTVTVSKQQLRIRLGESGSIECTPQGNPLPTVRWIKSDGEFRSGIGQSGNTLIISDAQKEDSAHYVCQGIVDGTVMATGYSAVEIESNEGRHDQLPEPVDIIVTKGADTSLSCDFDTGDYEQQVAWARRDQRPLPQNAQKEGNELVVRSATQEDSGEYVCTVTASRGGFLLRVALFRLEILPLVSVHPAVQTVTRGQAVTVECAVDEEGAQVTWDRVDKSLSSRVEDRGSQLYFSGIEVEDSGYYRCSARNRAGISSGIAQVIVNDEPQTSSPANLRSSNVIVSHKEVTIPRGESVSIGCTPEGSPLPTVRWIKSNGEFRDGIRQNGNTLIISDAREEDRGHYACQGIVDGTVMVTDYSRVDVENVNPPARLPRSTKLIVSERELIIPTGGSATIECTPEGNPLPRVQWIKSNGEFRYGVRQSGNTLVISDARKEDRGHYACQGIVDGTVILTNYSRIDVLDVPQTSSPANLRSSNVIVSHKEVTIPRGESVSIGCTPEGSPLPTVRWIKSNGEFREGISQSGNTLIISDAREEDRGHYACQGIVDGTVMVTDYSRVDVGNDPQTPPSANLRSSNVIVSHKQLKIPRGGRVSIQCTPEGSPLPTVRWIKSNGEFRDGIRQNGNTLIISDARKEDGGHYACQGIVDGTVMVTDYSRVDVEDDEQPPVVTGDSRVQVSVRQVKIPRGGNKSVECTPEGNPLPTIQWRKHEGAFSLATRQSGNALVISDAQEQDGGYYACDGMVDGIAAWTDYLAVEIESSEPNSQSLAYPRVTVNMRHLRIPRGGHMSIDCTPEGSPLPTIQWTKDEGNFGVGTRQSGNSLIIKDAQEEDRGNYVCSAIVNGESVFSDYLTIEIQYNCELPKDTGSCLAAFDRWYYDPAQQKCQKFIWGGCGGNKNNFETEEQCSLECESMRPIANAA